MPARRAGPFPEGSDSDRPSLAAARPIPAQVRRLTATGNGHAPAEKARCSRNRRPDWTEMATADGGARPGQTIAAACGGLLSG